MIEDLPETQPLVDNEFAANGESRCAGDLGRFAEARSQD
jgi:hypothetical protein